ncbi:hypothetical protein HPMG_00191 [Helicobacter pullorum MIT 98-5489]|uniref:Uncharacterized protein n=1 Tax=Helicobacter pullorum MIT 98-5489 TaxID=537972 RepID=C5EXW4_9HELI|nr:hypothetical protein HPMG_00191 [Helicobacter pullorum MIT 98-5489]
MFLFLCYAIFCLSKRKILKSQKTFRNIQMIFPSFYLEFKPFQSFLKS